MTLRDRHSRVVAWLRVLLPLSALTILSTLFLLSSKVEPPSDLPFAEVGLEDRARRQQLTRPSISGATDRGDLIKLTADSVRPDPERQEIVHVSGVTARIDTVDGRVIRLRANSAEINRSTQRAELRGDVVVTASNGYEIHTDMAQLAFAALDASASGAVRATGPEGQLTAGGMRLTSDPTTNDIHLVFTNRVKLIYDAQSPKE
ncbi:LPS export ABC transporter periplasmic protein LptC [Pseudooceanicola sp.]|uniref:LPS export ABC transporter periplasmic protein LptC n=1 Tax=Pseudooceanicola sp. TaxID=1914328 RepID=UPI00261315D2|nr:LPS export ABC transporter periplasmic protein LptC [Pseudooceanicola sp.]MDF1856657.1 LPS export ABC transporter periplasmic protein LptC [Pseudooceanicola sp.]